MPFDSIRDLRIFARIYEQGSITAASSLLGITPAVASKRLKRLEHDAGEALFHRSTRRLSATGAGDALYRHAVSIIAAAEEAETRMSGGREPSGFLRVTSSIGFGRLYLSRIIAAFLERYPRVRIDAVFTDRVLDMVDDQVDVAVRISPPLEQSALIMHRICSGRRILCASPEYLRARGRPRTPSDLERHDCVVLNHYDVWRLAKRGRTESVRVSGGFHSNDGEAVLDAVKSGLGIGVVALWHGARDIRAGCLVPVLDDYELRGQPEVYAVYHPNQRHVLRIRRLIEFIDDRLDLPFADPGEVLDGAAAVCAQRRPGPR